MPKQTATAKMEGTRKSERPRERWKDDIEKNLYIMETKNSQAMFIAVGNGERWNLKQSSTQECSA